MNVLRLLATMAFVGGALFMAICLGAGAEVRHNAIGENRSSEGVATIHECRPNPWTLWSTWVCSADIRIERRFVNTGERHPRPQVESAHPLSGQVRVEGWRRKSAETFVPAGPHSNVPWSALYAFGTMILITPLIYVLSPPEWRRRA